MVQKVSGLRKVILDKYTDPSFPSSFAGLNSFFKEIKKVANVSKNEVKEVLSGNDVYSLHFPSRKRFKTNKVIVHGIDHSWQADLVDVQSLAKQNKWFKYLLTVIDVFSKFAWVVPLKNKDGLSVTQAFQKILGNRKPKKLQTDKGKEFYNKHFKDLMKKHSIHLYSTNSDFKASVIERFNRTLKQKMWKMFTINGNEKYFKDLENLVTSYNSSRHRSIKMAPSSVNDSNKDTVFQNLYGYDPNEGDESYVRLKFRKGDLVKVSKEKFIYSKGYTQKWTHENFVVNRVLLKVPPVYELKDLKGEEIEGIYYAEELQKVSQ